MHYNGSEETVELILRTVISVNQLGAVADLCKELNPDSRNQTEGEIFESLVIPTEITYANATSQSSTSLAQEETCCKNTNGNSQNFLMIRNCRNYAPTLVSYRKLGKDNSSLQLKKDLRLCRQHVENTHNLEIWKHPDREGGFARTRKSAQSRM